MPAAVSRSLRSPRVLIAAGMILCILFCAVFAGRIAPNDPSDQNLLAILAPPAWMDGGDPAYPLGTDSLGRCVLSRLIYGARTAMLVAFFASLGAMLIGSILAHISGYFGGTTDWIIGGLVDIWMSFPPVILSLILMVGLGVGLDRVILAIILVDWTRFCRVLRSEVLIVTLARLRCCGAASWLHPLAGHRPEVLPATLPLLITLVSIEWRSPSSSRPSFRSSAWASAPTRRRGPDDRRRRQYVINRRGISCCRSIAIFLDSGGPLIGLGDGLRRTLDVRLAEGGR